MRDPEGLVTRDGCRAAGAGRGGVSGRRHVRVRPMRKCAVFVCTNRIRGIGLASVTNQSSDHERGL